MPSSGEATVEGAGRVVDTSSDDARFVHAGVEWEAFSTRVHEAENIRISVHKEAEAVNRGQPLRQRMPVA